jgi:hypothetical protein
MILYYFLFLMRVYLSTNLWNFYTNKTVYSSTVYHLDKISKETPIWYKYLVKGTCIFRSMEHGILELHRCRIWYAYAQVVAVVDWSFQYSIIIGIYLRLHSVFCDHQLYIRTSV